MHLFLLLNYYALKSKIDHKTYKQIQLYACIELVDIITLHIAMPQNHSFWIRDIPIKIQSSIDQVYTTSFRMQ